MTTNRPYITNNNVTLSTEIGRFMIEQRNVGYSTNDGRWLLTLLPEHSFGTNGRMIQRRPGQFLGGYDSLTAAVGAMHAFSAPPAETNTSIN